MAGVTLAAGAFGDPRFEYLAELCSFADADHARGKMAKLISRCTALGTDTPPAKVITVCLGRNGVEAIVEADLGELLPDGTIRVKGCEGRTEWFVESSERGTAGGKARASSAPRAGGKFVRSTTNDQRTTSEHQQTAAAGDSLAPANQRPPDQDQDLDLPDTHTGSESAVPEPSAIGGGDQALVTRGALPDAWQPADTPENREAGKGAVARGVVLAYALAKFHELSRARGTLALDWDAAWRLFLLAERPTPASFVISAPSAAIARAALDRERREADERKQRAEADREEVRRAARAVVASLGGNPNVEKTTK